MNLMECSNQIDGARNRLCRSLQDQAKIMFPFIRYQIFKSEIITMFPCNHLCKHIITGTPHIMNKIFFIKRQAKMMTSVQFSPGMKKFTVYDNAIHIKDKSCWSQKNSS